MALGDVAAGRARQDRVAAAGLSSEVDPLTGTMIYCSILWTCRTFADWSRAAQWTPGFDLWCKSAFAEVTSACRLHGADVLASVGRLGDALAEVERSVLLLIEEGAWELGDVCRVRGDIRAMMEDAAAVRADPQLSLSLGWDVEPGLARLRRGRRRRRRARGDRPLARLPDLGRAPAPGLAPHQQGADRRRLKSAQGLRRGARRPRRLAGRRARSLRPRHGARGAGGDPRRPGCARGGGRLAANGAPALARHPPRLSRRSAAPAARRSLGARRRSRERRDPSAAPRIWPPRASAPAASPKPPDRNLRTRCGGRRAVVGRMGANDLARTGRHPSAGLSS